MAAMDLRIKVNRDELIEHLKENKTAHEAEYQEAYTAYFNKLRSDIAELLHDANQCVFRNDGYRLSLQPPVNQTEMYDKYIKMLSMSQDSLIEIGVDEYTKFVDDQWEWAVSAKLFNSQYLRN